MTIVYDQAVLQWDLQRYIELHVKFNYVGYLLQFYSILSNHLRDGSESLAPSSTETGGVYYKK